MRARKLARNVCGLYRKNDGENLLFMEKVEDYYSKNRNLQGLVRCEILITCDPRKQVL